MNYSRKNKPNDIRYIFPINVIPEQNKFSVVSVQDPNSGKPIDQLALDIYGSPSAYRFIAMRNIDECLSWHLDFKYVQYLSIPDINEYKYIR